MGSLIRVVGGWVADRLGGIVALSVILLVVAALFLSLTAAPPLALTTHPVHGGVRGAGRRQRRAVPAGAAALAAIDRGGRQHDRRDRCARRLDPAERDGIVEAGHRQFQRAGFVFFALLSVVVLAVLYAAQRKWTRTWVGPGGRAIVRAVARRAGGAGAGGGVEGQV